MSPLPEGPSDKGGANKAGETPAVKPQPQPPADQKQAFSQENFEKLPEISAPKGTLPKLDPNSKAPGFTPKTAELDLTRTSFSSENASFRETYKKKQLIQDEVAFLKKLAQQEIYLLPSQRTGTSKYITPVERDRQRGIVTEDRFKKYAQPFIIPGREDVCIISYSGLVTPNYPLRRFLSETYRRFGFRTELYSLYGHDGTHESLAGATHDKMLDFLKEKVSGLPQTGPDKKPNKRIFVGYSTGALAGLALEAQYPGTFDAMILIGAPMFIKNPWHHRLLSVVAKVEFVLSKLGALAAAIDKELDPEQADKPKKSRGPFAYISRTFYRWGGELANMLNKTPFSMQPNPPKDPHGKLSLKELRKTPHFAEFKLLNLLSVYRLGTIGKQGLTTGKTAIPIFTCQGTDDPFCRANCADFILENNKMNSEAAQLLSRNKIYANTPHAVFFGPHGKEFMNDGWKFMQDVLGVIEPNLSLGDMKQPTYSMPGKSPFKGPQQESAELKESPPNKAPEGPADGDLPRAANQ